MAEDGLCRGQGVGGGDQYGVVSIIAEGIILEFTLDGGTPGGMTGSVKAERGEVGIL